MSLVGFQRQWGISRDARLAASLADGHAEPSERARATTYLPRSFRRPSGDVRRRPERAAFDIGLFGVLHRRDLFSTSRRKTRGHAGDIGFARIPSRTVSGSASPPGTPPGTRRTVTTTTTTTTRFDRSGIYPGSTPVTPSRTSSWSYTPGHRPDDVVRKSTCP